MSANAPTEAAAVPRRSVFANDAVRRWSILGLLCLAFIAAYIDRQNLAAAVINPGFRDFFKLSQVERGWLHSAFFWTYLVLQVPSGWLVDRFGAKRTLAAGFVLWSLASAATGFSTGFTALFIFRMFLGIGEACVNPAGMRWIRFNIPEEQRGLAVGIYQASAKVGLAVGVPIAGFLMDAFNWQAMFVMLGVGCMLWLIPWMWLVRDDDRQIEASQQKTSGAPPVPFARVLASPVIWGTILGTFAYQYFLYFTVTWMTTYFAERRHLDLSSTYLFSFVQYIGMAVVAILAGWAADRMIKKGRDPVKVRKRFAIAGLLIGSTQIIGAFAESNGVAIFFAVLSLSGLGLMTANYWALTQTLIPGGSVGRIVGLQNMAAQAPGIVAPILTGWLVQKTGNYEAPMVLIAVFLAIGIAAYLFLVKREYAPRPG
jgi:ACS family D-galactonate transporter-like MFS transporter